MRVLRVLSAARGCVPAIDAILFYSRSQRGDDAAVISFLIILVTHISSYDDDDDDALVVSPTRTPCEFSSLPRIRVPIFVPSNVGGAGNMIWRPLCVYSDLDSSPPWVMSYPPFCVMSFEFFLFIFFVLFHFLPSWRVFVSPFFGYIRAHSVDRWCW